MSEREKREGPAVDAGIVLPAQPPPTCLHCGGDLVEGRCVRDCEKRRVVRTDDDAPTGAE